MESIIDPALLEPDIRQHLRYLQALQNSFASVSQMAICIVRPNGKAVTRTSGHTELYNTLMSNPTAVQLCKKNIARLLSATRKSGQIQLDTCDATGLRMAAVPLRVHNDDCYWLVGQVRDQIHLDHYDSYAIQLAHATGLSSKQLKIQYCNLPEMDDTQFMNNLRLLQRVSLPAGVGETSFAQATKALASLQRADPAV